MNGSSSDIVSRGFYRAHDIKRSDASLNDKAGLKTASYHKSVSRAMTILAELNIAEMRDRACNFSTVILLGSIRCEIIFTEFVDAVDCKLRKLS